MRRTQLLYDGLWRCLCPAVDKRSLSQAIASSALRQVRAPLRQAHGHAQAQAQAQAQARPYTAGSLGRAEQEGEGEGEGERQRDAVLEPRPPPTARQADAHMHPKTGPEWDAYILSHRTPDLEDAPDDRIVAALRILRSDVPPDGKLAKVQDRHKRIVQLVKFLIQKRKCALDAFIYECMMDAMIDPQGSAAGIRQLLKDMQAQAVSPTESICRSAIRALAVHPDYLLRLDIIDIMRQYWYSVDEDLGQYVILGMLRDGQYEMAYSKLEKLLDQGGTTVHLWVYDIFIVVFGQMGFLDETLRLLQRRKHARGTDDAFRNLLVHCLDVFSQGNHIEGTAWIWESAVRNELLTPSNASLDSVLATASRNADTSFAAEIIEVLAARGRLAQYQYEALVEAFAGANDIPGALRVLSIMARSGIAVVRGSTRKIYQAIKRNPRLIEAAVAGIDEIFKGQYVPLQALSVVIESIARIRGTDAALDLYHNVTLFTDQRPDYPMMKELILNSSNVETTWMLAKDYVLIARKDFPGEDSRIYDELIPACAERGDFDLAFSLVERSMVLQEEYRPDQRSWRKSGWAHPLVDHALRAEDNRIWPIVDELVQGNDECASKAQILLQRHRMVKRAEEWKAQKRGEGA